MNKPLVVERHADNGEHSRWELINPKTGEVLRSEPEGTQSTLQCKGCNADLTLRHAIYRKYINKDDEHEIRTGSGHYDKNGDYVPDRNTDLSDGRYGLYDGSDHCSICDEIVG